MADEKKLKQINKYGIIIHQLQREDKNAALSYFSRRSVEKLSYSSEGLCIFFKEYDLAIKSILRQKIKVGELFYKIYPMVTNLTICGIGPYAPVSVIEDVMRSYSSYFIIDSYRIKETMEHNGCKTVSLTDDYRIILDVPEVYAPNLTPVRLPNITDRIFEVLFFCRTCRHNGHMQFQCVNCRNSSSSSPISHQNTEVYRQLSWEIASSDVGNNYNRARSPQSYSYADPQNSTNDSKSHVKFKREQNDFSDQSCRSKDVSHKNDSLKSYSVKPTHSKSKNCHNVHKITDNMDIRRKRPQDNFSSKLICDKKKFKNNSSSSKRHSTEFLQRRSSEKRNSHQHSESEGDDERVRASTSNKRDDKQTSVASSKRKKNKLMHLLSNILPPNIDLVETKKLIKIAYKCDPKDIPADVKTVLVTIQKYNRGQKKKHIDKQSRRFLHWINTVLNKLKAEKIHKKISHSDPIKQPIKKQERVKDGKSATKMSKVQSPRKRKISLSSGIREAVSKTAGELQPAFLCNFLNQVRGRKKLFEVASIFTKNISGLASQLLEVQNTYYKYVQKRGPEEDRDISYIKRLRLRLLQHNKNAAEISLKRESEMMEMHFKTESDMTGHVKAELDRTEIPVKLEPNMTEISVKTESYGEEELHMTNAMENKTDMTEIPIKSETEIFMRQSIENKTDTEEIPIKSETEIFMRQSGNDGTFVDKNISHNLYTPNYFTNITQMPFSLDYIKTEPDDID